MLEYHRYYNLIHNLPVQNSPVPAFDSDKNKSIQQNLARFSKTTSKIYMRYVHIFVK